jgi:hypothetical protein
MGIPASWADASRVSSFLALGSSGKEHIEKYSKFSNLELLIYNCTALMSTM